MRALLLKLHLPLHENRLFQNIYPFFSECVLESRYLGLQIPEEVEKIDEKLEHLARVMEDTVDLDGILELARNVSQLQFESPFAKCLISSKDAL